LLKALEPVLLQNTARLRETSKSGKTAPNEITRREYAEVASFDIQSPQFQFALGEMHQASRVLLARGESVWLRRQNRAVFIDRLDMLGELVSVGFARAGIGALVCGDQTVTHLENLQDQLTRLPLRPRVFMLSELKETQISRIDLAVLTGQQIIEPQKFAAWINRGVPALGAIAASAADNLDPFIGHVIVPAKTPCWVCLEQHRQALNSNWADMASQLVGREMRFDAASTALTLAGRVVSQGLTHIDKINGFETQTRLIAPCGPTALNAAVVLEQTKMLAEVFS